MTLGEKWKQELNKKSDKEILFEAIEERVNEAIQKREKTVWFTRSVNVAGINVTEELLQEFANNNGLKLEKVNMAGWNLMPL